MAVLEDLRDEVNRRVYAAGQYVVSYDSATITHAKEVAKEYKVKYQDILKGMRPYGSVITKVWDEYGNIVPYEKVFGKSRMRS